jgi:hypothetical protein
MSPLNFGTYFNARADRATSRCADAGRAGGESH